VSERFLVVVLSEAVTVKLIFNKFSVNKRLLRKTI